MPPLNFNKVHTRLIVAKMKENLTARVTDAHCIIDSLFYTIFMCIHLSIYRTDALVDYQEEKKYYRRKMITTRCFNLLHILIDVYHELSFNSIFSKYKKQRDPVSTKKNNKTKQKKRKNIHLNEQKMIRVSILGILHTVAE